MKAKMILRKAVFLLLAALSTAGCMDLSTTDPYAGSIHSLTVKALYPDGFGDRVREGVLVQAEDIASGTLRKALTQADGSAVLRVPNGIYRVSVNDRHEGDIFGGSADKVLVSGADATLSLRLVHSKAGTLVIKELYTGGCSKAPLEGTYQSDKYAIIHNNDDETAYLDGLCFGTLSPYNSAGANPWISRDPETGEIRYRDYAPIIQCIWQFGGDGTSFPLASGADAVICLNGAIDHTLQYPLSVNLNQPDYFACYNTNYFPNTLYHPAPGDRIRADHILEVVIKTGQANAYTISMSSPTFVLFRARGTTMRDFVADADHIVQVPGGSEQMVALPLEWIIDGVEVFDGRSTANTKRLAPSVDAGYVVLSDIYKSHALLRKTDAQASAEKGFEVLQDTNNSSDDFDEQETQSLHR